MPRSLTKAPTYLEQLNHQIKQMEPIEKISVDRYLFSGQNLLNQANIYRRAEDSASVYIFLFRFANLMLYTIPKHPGCVENAPKFLHYRKKLRDEVIPELEKLKEEFSDKPAVIQIQRSVSADLVPVGLSAAPQVNWKDCGAPKRDALPPRPTEEIPANIRALNKSMSMPPAPIFASKYSASSEARDKHSLFTSPATEVQQPTSKAMPSAPLYPTTVDMPKQPPLIDDAPIVDIPKEIPLGPQEVEVQNVSVSDRGLENMETCSCQPPPISQATATQLSESDSVKAVQKTGFRNIHVSVDMMESFLRVAKSNTAREIETCAILAGELRPDLNVLEVNHLLVPRQKGTRDQVEMIDEELLLGEVLSKGLMVLGWIHTHPVFQCFLSSIDVHTTLPYQLLLEEAIAIVMAPTDRRRKCGVFRLTTPGGMNLIRDCPHRGFHQHGSTSTGQPIYEVSSHVFFDPKLSVTVKDMR